MLSALAAVVQESGFDSPNIDFHAVAPELVLTGAIWAGMGGILLSRAGQPAPLPGPLGGPGPTFAPPVPPAGPIPPPMPPVTVPGATQPAP